MSQVDGIGDVVLSGSSLPAVRVELNPRALFKYGVGLEDVRAALSAANANSPKGAIEQRENRYQLYVNDTATKADQYKSLIVAYRNNAAVRLSDIADVSDGVEDVRNLGMADGQGAVLVLLSKQPGANVIDTVDRVKALLPQMQAALPPSVHLGVVNDSTTTIRASVHDVERTLILATLFVLLVVFLFLRSVRAAIVPSIAVPLSLIGTFGVMYLLGYSLDNFSLMALTISTGFVVDDAIVVLENVTRHIEEGKSRAEAALLGAREVSFTVLAMSLSLIAVFVPILLMGGLVGRLFHEFAVTLSVCNSCVACRFAHHHTNDVCLSGSRSEPGARNLRDAPVPPDIQIHAGSLRPQLALVARKPRHYHDCSGVRDRHQFLSLGCSAQGFLPTTRFRQSDGWHSRRPDDFVPGDGTEIPQIRPDHS